LEATGFHDADLTRPGSDKLIDAAVTHGTADDIAKRLGPDQVLPALSELAGPLGLSS
jgi:hypothetical protein